ncbi:spore-associated protein A [Streptomyces minutiscleroticus]|uniref:Spore-associated protein A n=1 Tax=Streptomyces minutiscleroticus TaxID=68238 RepID=A0A918ND23_9ACTN|nr:spore-associated protein A [Streptomyces minutiscleroticus]GGX58621.1 spore-associated protein A [Streptomyces minutiscleroticus]
MKRSTHAAGAALLTVAAVGAGVLATAPVASAAPAGATAAYNGACGSGYSKVNSMPVGNVGTVYLTYNSSNGRNCVVTIRNTSGSPTYMVSYLSNIETGDTSYDEGEYRSYAGPVYVSARGECVEWGGVIGNVQAWNYGSNCGTLAAKKDQKDWFAGER